jgi:uncharacterized protein (DUF305 family)
VTVTVSTVRGQQLASSEHDFLTTMVAHDREAIVAAGQLARSGRPEMRALGHRIVRRQARQVRRLRRWLDRWYWAAPLPDHYQPTMRDLTSLEGDDLDHTVLTELDRHHVVAVTMSRQLLQQGLVRHRQVARLAETIEDRARRRLWRVPGAGDHRP